MVFDTLRAAGSPAANSVMLDSFTLLIENVGAFDPAHEKVTLIAAAACFAGVSVSK